MTIYEAGAGFLIGAVMGILCGIALGRNQLLSDVFSIYIKVANSIPRVVLGSIFIVALGLGAASKIALAVVMVFFVVFANAFQGVREADKNLIANARILGASDWQMTRAVVIPSALSWILASLHVSFGFALVGAIVGEFLGAREGMGLLIATAQGSFDSNGVFAAMIVIAVVALIAEWLLTMIEDRLLTWRPETRRTSDQFCNRTPEHHDRRRRAVAGKVGIQPVAAQRALDPEIAVHLVDQVAGHRVDACRCGCRPGSRAYPR